MKAARTLRDQRVPGEPDGKPESSSAPADADGSARTMAPGDTSALSAEEVAQLRTQLLSRGQTSEATDQLRQQRDTAEAKLAAVEAQLAVAEAKLQRLQAEHQDSSQMRREVVKEMSQEWSGLSKVIESTLLEHSVHSPNTEQLLHRAERAAREANPAAAGEAPQVKLPSAGAAAPAAAAEADPAKGGDAAADVAAGAVADAAPKQPDWSASEWVQSLDVSALVARSLLSRAGGGNELAFIQMLAADEAHGRDALLALLRVGLLEALADRLWEGCAKLRATRAASGQSLHAKFLADRKACTLSCASLALATTW